MSINPLDKLVWPPEVSAAPNYGKVRFGRRFAARIIDVLFAGLPFFACAILIALAAALAPGSMLAAIAIPVMVCAFGWGMYYMFTKDGRDGGQSVGKKTLNLMVVNIGTNRPCSKGESCLRELDLMFLQMIPIVGWVVEPIVMLASERGRRLGDRAANTQVIDASEYVRSPRSVP